MAFTVASGALTTSSCQSSTRLKFTFFFFFKGNKAVLAGWNVCLNFTNYTSKFYLKKKKKPKKQTKNKDKTRMHSKLRTLGSTCSRMSQIWPWLLLETKNKSESGLSFHKKIRYAEPRSRQTDIQAGRRPDRQLPAILNSISQSIVS